MKTILFFTFFFLQSLLLRAQHAELMKYATINSETNYIYHLNYSTSGSKIILNLNQQGGLLLDSSLHEISPIYYPNFQSSGFTKITDNEMYVLQIQDNYDENFSQLSILKLEDNSNLFIKLPLFSKYIPFSSCNKVLIYVDGFFDIYNIETGELEKEKCIDISEEHTKSITSMMLYENDTKLLLNYTKRPPKFTDLLVYDMRDFSLKKRMPKPAFNISETLLSRDKQFYFYSLSQPDFVKESVHIKSCKTDSLVDSIPTNLEHILEVALSPDNSFLIIRDYHLNLYHFDRKSRKLTPLIECGLDDNFGAIAICPDNKHFLVSMNGNKLLKYKIVLENEVEARFEME